jgi:hypothetical protein
LWAKRLKPLSLLTRTGPAEFPHSEYDSVDFCSAQ